MKTDFLDDVSSTVFFLKKTYYRTFIEARASKFLDNFRIKNLMDFEILKNSYQSIEIKKEGKKLFECIKRVMY